MEVWEEITENERLLTELNATLLPNWIKFAEAERKYRIAKAKAILKLRNAGCPTTLITDIVKGDQDVADLNFERMVAEAQYKSNIEAINVAKQKANDLRMYFESEWRNTK